MALPDPPPDTGRRPDPPPPPDLTSSRPSPPPSPPAGGPTPARGTPPPDAPVRVARATDAPDADASAFDRPPRPATVDVPTSESPAARPEGDQVAAASSSSSSSSSSSADERDPAEGRSLRSDLAEVAGAKPERAFNVGATLGILLTVAAVVFVVQNSGATAFEFLWFDFRLPLWTVLVATLAVGVLLTLTAFALHRRRRRRIARREQATGRLQRALPEDRSPKRRRFSFPRRHNAPA